MFSQRRIPVKRSSVWLAAAPIWNRLSEPKYGVASGGGAAAPRNGVSAVAITADLAAELAVSGGKPIRGVVIRSHSISHVRSHRERGRTSAREHLADTIRWPRTDKNSEADLDDTAAIVGKVAGAYRA